MGPLIDDNSRCRGMSALDLSPYEQVNTTIKDAYCHMPNRHATRMKTPFGLDLMETNAPRLTLCEKKFADRNFKLKCFAHRKRRKCILVWKSWSVIYCVVRSALSLGNNPSTESGNPRSLLKMLSSHAVKFQLDLVTKTVVQDTHLSASLELCRVYFNIFKCLVKSF